MRSARKQQRHETTRRIINTLVVDLTRSLAARARCREAGRASATSARAPAPLISFSDEIEAENLDAQALSARPACIHHHQVYRIMVKAKRVVRELFAALFEDPRLLPPDFHADGEADGSAGAVRTAAHARWRTTLPA